MFVTSVVGKTNPNIHQATTSKSFYNGRQIQDISRIVSSKGMNALEVAKNVALLVVPVVACTIAVLALFVGLAALAIASQAPALVGAGASLACKIVIITLIVGVPIALIVAGCKSSETHGDGGYYIHPDPKGVV